MSTGFPVRHSRVELERDVGPYRAGCERADADVEHAAEQMRRVFEDVGEREARARRGQEFVRRRLSHEAVGRILRRRVEEIQRVTGRQRRARGG